MAESRGPGSIGTRTNPARVPAPIRGHAVGFPGPVGSDAWTQAARAARSIRGAERKGPPSPQERAAESTLFWSTQPNTLQLPSGAAGDRRTAPIPRASAARVISASSW